MTVTNLVSEASKVYGKILLNIRRGSGVREDLPDGSFHLCTTVVKGEVTCWFEQVVCDLYGMKICSAYDSVMDDTIYGEGKTITSALKDLIKQLKEYNDKHQ